MKPSRTEMPAADSLPEIGMRSAMGPCVSDPAAGALGVPVRGAGGGGGGAEG